MYDSPFGKEEGLSARLEKWANDLGKNRSYPWVGLGLIEDLRAAAAVLDGRPIPIDPYKGMPDDEPITQEYDL